MKIIISSFIVGLLSIANSYSQEFEEIKVNTYKDNDSGKVVADCGTDLEFDEDNGLIIHTKTQKPYTGRCRSYYEDNSPERVVDFVDGKEDGMSLTWYKSSPESPNMQLMVRTNHNMGVPDGVWDFYYENGQRAWTETYKEGLKHGNCNYYYEDGKPKKEEVYKDNLKDGNCKEYYPDNKIKSEIGYKAGVMDGQYKSYYENGQISYEGKFTNGKENGEVVTYYEKGQMSSQGFFKGGIADGEFRTWYDDSKEKSITKFVNGKRDGTSREFYKDGQVKKIEKWVAGKRMDIEAFDEFGNKLDPDEIKN